MLRALAPTLLILAALAVGCETQTGSDLTPLQSRALHTRDLGAEMGATYDEVWWGTITALQDAGFTLRQADKQSGFIYGIWMNYSQPDRTVPVFGIALSHNEVEVSVTLEERGETHIVVRLSCRVGAGGESQDDAQFPQRFFAAVRKEIFVRAAARRLGGVHMSSTPTTTPNPGL